MTTFLNIAIESIRPDPQQPRRRFDEDKLAELAESIKAHGILEPLLVVPKDDHYQLVFGERRFRAAQLAGLQSVPCMSRHMSESEILEAQLIENMQRADMDALEEAHGFQRLLDMGNITQTELAAKLGKSQAYVANRLRLLRLPDEVQEIITREMMPPATALALVKAAPWPAVCLEAAKELIRRQTPSREAPEVVDAVMFNHARPLYPSWHPNVGEYIDGDVASEVAAKLVDGDQTVQLSDAYHQTGKFTMDVEAWEAAYEDAKIRVESRRQEERRQGMSAEQAEEAAELQRERIRREIRYARNRAIFRAVIHEFGATLDNVTLWAVLLISGTNHVLANSLTVYRMAKLDPPENLIGNVRDEDRDRVIEGLVAHNTISAMRAQWLEWALSDWRVNNAAAAEALFATLSEDRQEEVAAAEAQARAKLEQST